MSKCKYCGQPTKKLRTYCSTSCRVAFNTAIRGIKLQKQVMDKEEKEAIYNEISLQMLKEIKFEKFPKENLVEFMNFFRYSHFKEFVKIYESYKEMLRGN